MQFEPLKKPVALDCDEGLLTRVALHLLFENL
jgi:hypothetical protein